MTNNSILIVIVIIALFLLLILAVLCNHYSTLTISNDIIPKTEPSTPIN